MRDRGRRFLDRASIARLAISVAMVAMSASVASHRVAYTQADAAFEVSPAVAAGPGNGPYGTARISRTPQRIAFRASLVGDIMAFTYELPLDRVERRPQWMYDDRYDVAVTTVAPTGLPEQKRMLQKLLEERFGLVAHRVSNDSPVYFLVAGAKVNLTAAEDGDAGDVPEFRYDFGRVCAARHVSMGDLAAWLYSQVGLSVIDKTGITGLFDIEISGLPIRGGAEGTIRAVRNSLGLDLELHRGTAESLIIDHVEEPRRN